MLKKVKAFIASIDNDTGEIIAIVALLLTNGLIVAFILSSV